MKIYSSPLDKCECCNRPFGSGPGESLVMYDAAVIVMGRITWANVCKGCFDAGRGQLGEGKGQKYELRRIDSGKAWVKVEG